MFKYLLPLIGNVSHSGYQHCLQGETIENPFFINICPLEYRYCTLIATERVGWCPKRRRRCSKQQFSLVNESRFIEPVRPWNQQQSECWRSLALNLQQTWTCTHSTKILCPQRRKGCQSFRSRRKQSG